MASWQSVIGTPQRSQPTNEMGVPWRAHTPAATRLEASATSGTSSAATS
jgi:hypothetical protein